MQDPIAFLSPQKAPYAHVSIRFGYPARSPDTKARQMHYTYSQMPIQSSNLPLNTYLGSPGRAASMLKRSEIKSTKCTNLLLLLPTICGGQGSSIEDAHDGPPPCRTHLRLISFARPDRNELYALRTQGQLRARPNS